MSLFVVLLATFFSTTSPAALIKDSTGFETHVVDHPTRIVTLIPSLGELASDLLGNDLDRIIGVSEFSDYPPALKNATSIGPYSKFNLERVMGLKPDLVLASTDGNSKDQIDHLRELKLPVVVVGSGTFSEVEQSMKTVAQALGVSASGEKMAAQLSAGLERIHESIKNRKKKKVMIQLGDDPLVVAGSGSFLQESVALLGAENIFSDSKNHYPRPSIEDVIQKNPDTIIILPLDDNIRPFIQMGKRWLNFPRIDAVKLQHIRVIRADSLLRPTLRLLEGISILEEAIYGHR